MKLPAEPSQYRVAVWRELREVGALSLSQGIWAVPDVPVFAEGVQRAVELTEGARARPGRWRLSDVGRVAPLASSGCSPRPGERTGRSSLPTVTRTRPSRLRRSAPKSSPWPSWRKRISRWSGCRASTVT
ncbi:Chromate resistance protein ChrB [Streptomyces sp. NPDC005529]